MKKKIVAIGLAVLFTLAIVISAASLGDVYGMDEEDYKSMTTTPSPAPADDVCVVELLDEVADESGVEVAAEVIATNNPADK